MQRIDRKDWQDSNHFISEPEVITEILRNARFSVTQFESFFLQLESRKRLALPNILSLARTFLGFRPNDTHLVARRAIAPFFTAAAANSWEPVIEAAVGRAIQRLAASDAPDLMGDFCEPLFIDVFRQIIGCTEESVEKLLELIQLSNDVVHPMVPIKQLIRIDAALGELRACLACDERRDPPSFMVFLSQSEKPEFQQLDMALSTFVASYAVAQTLAFSLYRLLLQDRDIWLKAAEPGWADQHLETLIARYASTRILVRVADEAVEVQGHSFAANETAILDIVGANDKLDHCPAGDPANLAFGSGRHRCPGAPLSRLFLGRAIPTLAKAFPQLALKRDQVRFKVNNMVQYPVLLPCVLDDQTVRQSRRLVDVRNFAEARSIVNDDKTWSPPQMAEHLSAVARHTGKDLQTALQIARNAMFFMSGPRHAASRRAVANSLGGNRLQIWQGLIEAETRAALDGLAKSPHPDLITDFSEVLFRNTTQQILGVAVRDQCRFDALAPTLQDVLEPWLSLRELDSLQTVFAELLDLMQLPSASNLPAPPLLSHLVASGLEEFSNDDLKALVLVLYGASFNLSHTLGNILHQLILLPRAERALASDPGWVDDNLEALISACASPKYIYRMARKSAKVGALDISAGETLRLDLLPINRGKGVGNLAFGHGLHHCVGAALTKRLLRYALPAFFSRFSDVSLVPQAHRYHELSQTVALAKLPCRLSL